MQQFIDSYFKIRKSNNMCFNYFYIPFWKQGTWIYSHHFILFRTSFSFWCSFSNFIFKFTISHFIFISIIRVLIVCCMLSLVGVLYGSSGFLYQFYPDMYLVILPSPFIPHIHVVSKMFIDIYSKNGGHFSNFSKIVVSKKQLISQNNN